MKPVLFAAVISLGLIGATGAALAAVPASNGHTYTEALNILSAQGYHDMNLVSRNGSVVHATATNSHNARVSVTVNTATGTVQSS